jgi:hypothetical protein
VKSRFPLTQSRPFVLVILMMNEINPLPLFVTVRTLIFPAVSYDYFAINKSSCNITQVTPSYQAAYFL